MYKCALILAAGQGTRIKSDLPKVLHKVCGKEMVNHVIDTLRKSAIEDINVIIGKGAELVKEKDEKLAGARDEAREKYNDSIDDYIPFLK